MRKLIDHMDLRLGLDSDKQTLFLLHFYCQVKAQYIYRGHSIFIRPRLFLFLLPHLLLLILHFCVIFEKYEIIIHLLLNLKEVIYQLFLLLVLEEVCLSACLVKICFSRAQDFFNLSCSHPQNLP